MLRFKYNRTYIKYTEHREDRLDFVAEEGANKPREEDPRRIVLGRHTPSEASRPTALRTKFSLYAM
jgi:hypothetical protein